MNFHAILLGIAFSLMWSSAFTSARVIVAHASPISALCLRFFLSGLFALAIAKLAGERLRLAPRQLRATMVLGALQNGAYLGLFFFALQTVEASLAAIIASTMPLIVAFAGWAILRERLPAMAILGLLSGLAGAMLIMGGRLGAAFDATGVILCILGTIALSAATMLVRTASSGGNVWTVIGVQMLTASACLAVVAALTETPQATLSWQLALAFSYTLIFPGIVATWVWFRLVNSIGTTRAATFHFLNPFFGVAVAWALLAEDLRLTDVIGVVIVGFGILAVQLSQPRPARAS